MSPRWTERQRAMLDLMGVHLWLPPEPTHPAPPSPTAPTAPTAPAASRPALADGAPAPRRALPEAPTRTAIPMQVPPASPRPSAAAPSPLPAASQTGESPGASAGPGPSGVGSMDWPALREAVAGCRACGLCNSRRQTVFGIGHPGAHWMLIGEAPGEQEDLQGEPFVGKAGQLLDNMLRCVGLTRQDAPPARQVYIANVLKCRPPANRNPEPQEVAQCEPFLKRQVELVAPRLILAMGRFAVQSLLSSHEPIGRLRGKLHRYHGVPVVVTYHPAYLLRNPLDKARAWEDLCLASEVLAQVEAERAAAPAP